MDGFSTFVKAINETALASFCLFAAWGITQICKYVAPMLAKFFADQASFLEVVKVSVEKNSTVIQRSDERLAKIEDSTAEIPGIKSEVKKIGTDVLRIKSRFGISHSDSDELPVSAVGLMVTDHVSSDGKHVSETAVVVQQEEKANA